MAEWELSKENVQPLKGGRDVDSLNKALKQKVSGDTDTASREQERRLLLQAIDSYSGEDPLRPWLKYLKWIKLHYPSGGLQGETLSVLEKCTKRFQQDGRYRSDIRYLRIWIQYADCCREPGDIFAFLDVHSIGQDHALYYEAYATYLELCRDFGKAQAVYEAGISRQAQPVARLLNTFQDFQQRMAKRIQRKMQAEEAAETRADQKEDIGRSFVPRQSLQALQGRKSSVHGQQPQQEKAAQRPQRPSTTRGTGIRVYVDEDLRGPEDENAPCTTSTGELGTSKQLHWSNIGTQAERTKENVQHPSKWTAAKMSRKRSQAAPQAPPLEVFVDEEFSKSGHKLARRSSKALWRHHIWSTLRKLDLTEVIPAKSDDAMPSSIRQGRDPGIKETNCHIDPVPMTFSDIPESTHRGLVDPTINTKEAFADIMSMFSKPLPCEGRRSPADTPTVSSSDVATDQSAEPISLSGQEDKENGEGKKAAGGGSQSPSGQGKRKRLLQPFPRHEEEAVLKPMTDFRMKLLEISVGDAGPSNDAVLGDCNDAASDLHLEESGSSRQDSFTIWTGDTVNERCTRSEHTKDQEANPQLLRVADTQQLGTTNALQQHIFEKRIRSEVEECTAQQRKASDNEDGCSNANHKLDNNCQGYNDSCKEHFGDAADLKTVKTRSKSGDLSLRLGKENYMVKACIGQGAYAKVYTAFRVDDPGDSDSAHWMDDNELALKVQRPAWPWEFYIYRQLDLRVPSEERKRFGCARRFHEFCDYSVMVCDYGEHGTLQDVINAYLANGQRMEEPLCMYYTIEMLRSLEVLHAIDILHADFKPDNLLIRNDCDTWCEWTPDRPGCWSKKGLTLIDWGRSIDLRCFPKGTAFMADCGTEAFRCTEMIEGKPWAYQVDYFGICGVAHCLLHGSYMDVEKVVTESGDLRYRPKSSLKRYWQTDLWQQLFSILLNASGSTDGPYQQLLEIRHNFEQYLATTPGKAKQLKLLLMKQNILMFDYLHNRQL
eukprot:SM000004S14935  [mRNA]  locus=s4:351711:358828:+ [translate_table: standard]